MEKKIMNKELEILKEIDTPTIINAIEYFKVRDETVGFGSMELKCLTPENKSMLGYALTVTVDTITPGPVSHRLSVFAKLLELIYKSSEPIVVCIKYVGPDRLRSCCIGDVGVSILEKLGSVGIVTDCGIRDFKEIRKNTPDFNVFAPGFVPSHGFVNYIELGSTVNIFGLTIKPGDLLHGDDNGVINIPDKQISIKDLIERIKLVKGSDNTVLNYLKSTEKVTLKGIIERYFSKDLI